MFFKYNDGKTRVKRECEVISANEGHTVKCITKHLYNISFIIFI